MTYHIDFSSVAKAEADAAFLTISQFTTVERVQLWYQGLIKAIASLREMPKRDAFDSIYCQGIDRYTGLTRSKGKSNPEFCVLNSTLLNTNKI